MALDIRIESARSSAALALAAALDALITRLYPGLPVNGVEPDFDAAGGVYAIGYANGQPVASGALRDEGGAAEIKRMYVVPAVRGRGYARAMLAFLEAEAARRGFARAILETGDRQPEAIALYRSAGWAQTDCYGPYVGEPVSLCFAKALAPASGDRIASDP
ncbi:MAG TPA: GNAT family N-acetyltransferase [Allosphingosinicella sp.]|jgi:GNAT superfamily N-acetyltransferase